MHGNQSLGAGSGIASRDVAPSSRRIRDDVAVEVEPVTGLASRKWNVAVCDATGTRHSLRSAPDEKSLNVANDPNPTTRKRGKSQEAYGRTYEGNSERRERHFFP